MIYPGYIPNHFAPGELFSKQVLAGHTENNWINSSIYRLLDSRIAWTADQIRERFGPMIVNDYIFNGSNQYRGFRPPIELIDWAGYAESGKIKTILSSFTSQHCSGRALDMLPQDCTAEEIREDIIKNPSNPAYQYITAIEKGVSWLHIDCRNIDPAHAGILLF